MDRGASWATIHGVAKSWTRSDLARMHANKLIHARGSVQATGFGVAGTQAPGAPSRRDRDKGQPWV